MRTREHAGQDNSNTSKQQPDSPQHGVRGRNRRGPHDGSVLPSYLAIKVGATATEPSLSVYIVSTTSIIIIIESFLFHTIKVHPLVHLQRIVLLKDHVYRSPQSTSVWRKS